MAIVNIFTSETVSNIFKIGYNFLCLAMNLLTSAVFMDGLDFVFLIVLIVFLIYFRYIWYLSLALLTIIEKLLC